MISSNKWIAQIYGYAVCLICVVVFFIALHAIIGSAFDVAAPLRADARSVMYSYPGPPMPLTSFEVYTLAARRQERMRMPLPQRADSVRAASLVAFSDNELRQNFNAEREDRIGTVRFHAMRQLVTGIIFVILAAALFLMHWRWLRRAETAAVAP